MLALACVAAAVFGALHNQISYAVGPSYFHDLKFTQFRISPGLHGPVGAALVGVLASWWMGIVTGLLPFSLGLVLISKPDQFFRVGLRCILVVVALAGLFAGIAALGGMWIKDDLARAMLPGRQTSDITGFARAAVMHDASYLGGAAGTLLALVITLRNRKAG